MTLEDYQWRAMRTKLTKKPDKGLLFTSCALAGEVGEVCNEVKKAFRDNSGHLGPDTKYRIVQELGDALWYLASACDDLGLSLNYVAEINLTKLAGRYGHAGNA